MTEIRNKDGESVQEKPTAKKTARTDRRIERTRDTLGDALVALIQEKSFEDITVQDLLDRAGIGRSTFYAHYRNKDDLFLSDMEDFLEGFANSWTRRETNAKRLAPVREFFAHIRDEHGLYGALVRTGKVEDVVALARGIFARLIEDRLRMLGSAGDAPQRSAHAHALAGSFFSLLDWWMDRGMKADPPEMDALFHDMAWNGMAFSVIAQG